MREPERLDPDSLLRKLKEDERRSSRGRLKIFFGYVAGVGKTYAMLEAAQRQAAAGVDIVVGYVETHGRPETDALLEGLEQLPILPIDYRGLKLRELNLDAALARHPQVILVDELAHTNAPGLRHTKRWQDVDELLGAGISVYTTLNVQHLESLNDIVREATGVPIRETVPDTLFDEADSVEVVDLPPGELLERLRQGKVYVPAQATRAMENFFNGPNLGALREITLRRTADRTHVHLETSRLTAGPQRTYSVSETLLVCIGPSPTSVRVIRTSKRMAASISARWIAASVETSRTRTMNEVQRNQLMANIRLAEALGAETATLAGDNVADEIVTFAHSQKATRIVIGKSREPRWRTLLGRNVVTQLLQRSGNIDIYVIQGLGEPERTPAAVKRVVRPYWMGYAGALALVLAAWVVARLLHEGGLSEANQAVVFLPAVVLGAVWWGLGPAIVAAVAAVLAFDFFFVPPYLTFAVQDVEYLLTLLVFAATGLLVGTLAARLRRQIQTSRSRENRLEVLFRLSRALSGVSGVHQLAIAAQHEVASIFGGAVDVYLPHGSVVEPVVSTDGREPHLPHELAVATWCFEHSQIAGKGTDTLASAEAIYLPLSTPRGTMGVIAVEPRGEAPLSPENRQLLETVATQVGIAMERDQLAEQRRCALVDAETERMRNSLLSSVSHDLRTPLAVIAGTTSTLLEMGNSADNATREALLTGVYDESNRLARLVENLLSMTRLDSGTVLVDKEWFPLEDVIGSALGRLRRDIGTRTISKHISPGIPLVPLDGVMIEQVLFNLIDNGLLWRWFDRDGIGRR